MEVSVENIYHKEFEDKYNEYLKTRLDIIFGFKNNNHDGYKINRTMYSYAFMPYKNKIINSFHNGVVKVEEVNPRNDTVMYVDEKGRLISEETFIDGNDFVKDCTTVVKKKNVFKDPPYTDKRFYILNRNGILSNVYVAVPKEMKARIFEDGAVLIYDPHYILSSILITNDRNIIEDVDFYDNGYYIKDNRLYYKNTFILAFDETPKDLFNGIIKTYDNGWCYLNHRLYNKSDYYDKIGPFIDGRGLVYKRDKGYNYLNEDLEFIGDTFYDEAWDFHDERALVKLNNELYFIDRNGNRISDNFDVAHSFSNGRAWVYLKDKGFNYIDTNGHLISDEWFQYAEDFKGNYGLVKDYSSLAFITKDGKRASSIEFDAVHNISENFATVSIDDVYYLYNIRDDIVYKNSFEYRIKDYTIEKSRFGKYILKNKFEKDKFIKLKYRPVMVYANYVLCLHKNNYYLYNKNSQTYQYFGNINQVAFNENFIFVDDKKYLIYGSGIINITSYYDKYLRYCDDISFVPNISYISKDYYIGSILRDEDKLCELIEEKEDEAAKEAKRIQELERIANAKRLEKERKKIETKKIIAENLKIAKEAILRVKERNQLCLDENIDIDRVDIGSIFIEVNGHKEIPDYIREGLQFWNLSNQDFRNANIQGIDFRGTNVTNIFPETVYNKDLRNCDFTGIYLEGVRGFNGVDIRGAKFSKDNDPNTYDVLPSFYGAIYDETTTYNGTPLTELIGPCENLKSQVK